MLTTERLLLREFVDDDFADVFAHESDPEVVRYLMFDVCTPEATRENLRRRRAYADETPRTNWDLAIERDGRVIGRCGIGIRGFRDATIWYLLDPRAQGQGYAVEAMRAILAYGFETLDLHRIWGDCDPRNPASARVMERLGMRREAHHVENAFIKGEWCDSWIYALLAREWREQRARDAQKLR